jgi:hypothetical protein
MDTSSLSDLEFVSLIATYNTSSDKDEKHKVSSKLDDRGYSADQLAHAKQKKTEKFKPVVSCDLRFTKPFDHLKFEPFGYVLTLFENYERGCLPFPGAASEQPAQIMEIFSVLRQLKHEAEIRLREKYTSNGRNKHQNKPGASR